MTHLAMPTITATPVFEISLRGSKYQISSNCFPYALFLSGSNIYKWPSKKRSTTTNPSIFRSLRMGARAGVGSEKQKTSQHKKNTVHKTSLKGHCAKKKVVSFLSFARNFCRSEPLNSALFWGLMAKKRSFGI